MVVGEGHIRFHGFGMREKAVGSSVRVANYGS